MTAWTKSVWVRYRIWGGRDVLFHGSFFIALPVQSSSVVAFTQGYITLQRRSALLLASDTAL
jgi:hypothetical protein